MSGESDVVLVGSSEPSPAVDATGRGGANVGAKGRRGVWLWLVLGGAALTVLGCVGTPLLVVHSLMDTVPESRAAVPGSVAVDATATTPLVIWVGRDAAPGLGATQHAPPPELSAIGLRVMSSAGNRLQVVPRASNLDVNVRLGGTVYSPMAEVKVPQAGRVTVYAQPPGGAAPASGASIAVGEDTTPIYTFIGSAVLAVVAMAGVVLTVLGLVLRR